VAQGVAHEWHWERTYDAQPAEEFQLFLKFFREAAF